MLNFPRGIQEGYSEETYLEALVWKKGTRVEFFMGNDTNIQELNPETVNSVVTQDNASSSCLIPSIKTAQKYRIHVYVLQPKSQKTGKTYLAACGSDILLPATREILGAVRLVFSRSLAIVIHVCDIVRT